MKRVVSLIALAIALLLAQSCRTSAAGTSVADASVLRGVRSVYIDSQDSNFQRLLNQELPQLRVVTRPQDADLVFEVDFTPARFSSAAVMTVAHDDLVSYTTGGNAIYQTRLVSVPEGVGTSSPGHAVGIARRADGRAVVIHEGFPEFFDYQFERRFIEAWRNANR